MIQAEERSGTLPTPAPAPSVRSLQVLDLARSAEEERLGQQARLEAIPLARLVNLQPPPRPAASLDSLRRPRQGQLAHLEVEDCLDKINQRRRRLGQVRICLPCLRRQYL